MYVAQIFDVVWVLPVLVMVVVVVVAAVVYQP